MPTQNEALLEAYASCPPSARIYYTLEIWQSSFAEPARVVANVGDEMVFGIESGARCDGGAMVTFFACPFSAEYPEQREGPQGGSRSAVRVTKMADYAFGSNPPYALNIKDGLAID